MDLAVLRDPPAVLQCARLFPRKGVAGKELLQLPISRAMAERVAPSGDFNVLAVPLVPAGREWRGD